MAHGDIGRILAVAYFVLAIVLAKGSIDGMRDGKFVLGRRLGFSPYAISRQEKPIQFWLAAATLAGLGAIAMVIAFLSFQNSN